MVGAVASRMARRILLPVLVLLAGMPAVLADPQFPALTGRVVDDANLLDSAQQQALTEKLAALEDKTTAQLVVVTLPSLQGEPIEDFGVRLGRHWAIGQKDKNNGVLLIVAPEERKVRIEVGYGLEGVLTDALARVIIDTAILPRFRAGDMAGGIIAGAEDIVAVLSGGAQEIEQRALSRPESSDEIFGIIFPLVIFFIILLIFFLVIRGGGSPGSWSSSSGRSAGSSWSGSSGGFSGGGGSFGGGGSSGSW